MFSLFSFFVALTVFSTVLPVGAQQRCDDAVLGLGQAAVAMTRAEAASFRAMVLENPFSYTQALGRVLRFQRRRDPANERVEYAGHQVPLGHLVSRNLLVLMRDIPEASTERFASRLRSATAGSLLLWE